MFSVDIIAKCIKDLKTSINMLENIKMPACNKLNISSKNLTKPMEVESLLKLIDNKNTNVIYVFYIDKGKVECVKNAAQKYRSKKGEIHFSQINNSNSTCLYVGSKITGIRGRIKQHIGTDNTRTYAMHLKSWIIKCDTNIHIEYYSFDDSVSRETVQLMENTLWRQKKPLLGKLGAK
ncbi:MAG: hypothetical protein RDU76_02500 [Candidatus Edwardsbacteria bacterium]|nr:hypothetical protein [Candidatus Edwardsbacteria bacterium]